MPNFIIKEQLVHVFFLKIDDVVFRYCWIYFLKYCNFFFRDNIYNTLEVTSFATDLAWDEKF